MKTLRSRSLWRNGSFNIRNKAAALAGIHRRKPVMDSGIKFILSIILLTIALTTGLWACEKQAPPEVTSEWRLEGTVGGRHGMSLTLRQRGETLSGEAVNTLGEPRSLAGRLAADQTFLFHEQRDGQTTGTFEGRMLNNGDLRGIWSPAQEGRWFPFYFRVAPAAPGKPAAGS